MKRLAIALLALLAASPLYAQNPNQAQLRLVVVDETGAGIPAASITVTPANGSPVLGTSDDRGLATLPDVVPGQVKIHVEFPGFLPTDETVTLRRGANNQTITLKIEGFQEQVVVSDTTATDDRRGNSMSTTLEQSEIEALPDDPDELADVLTQMAGGAGAVFQVNGFRGGSLPSRDEIRQIRFRTNSFSADNHDAGRTQVEIITRPNVRAWNGNANMNYRSDAMNARNAFADEKTPEKNNQFNLGLRGPIVAGKTSLRINVDGRRDTQADTIYAVDPTAAVPSQDVRIRHAVSKPNDSTNVTVGIEHALTNNNTLRLEFRNGESSASNQGVGGYNLEDRATSREGNNQQFRAQIQGIVGKTSLNELRFQYIGSESTTTSFSDAQAIVVTDAFTTGGAGANNHSSSKTWELADNFDFNVGRKQQMRVGFLLEGGSYNYFDQTNANGTWTFDSVEDFINKTPSFFRIRTGEVTTDFDTTQLGIYWQDDIKLSNRFSFSVGLRNEMQSLLDDKLNLMPRVGFTYTPRGNKTSIRGGYGLFYDWYDSSLYDQTLRLNGGGQADELYVDPVYPDYTLTPRQNVQPGGRTFADPNLKMPVTHQASIGVERQITQNFSAQLSYQMLRARDQMRALNDNQPVATPGFDAFGNPVTLYVRPDPTVANLTHIQSIGRQDSDRLTLNLNYRLPNRNIFMGGNYTLGSVKSDFDSATALPTDSLHPELDWGPTRGDVRHRVQAMLNLPIKYGVRTNFNINAQSGSPYNVTIGQDINQDGVVNERPEGEGRNSRRGAAIWTINMRLSKVFAIGIPGGGSTPQPGGGGPRGGGQVNQQRAQGGGRQGGNAFNPGRYNVEIFASADNLLNRVNYSSYSGKIYNNPDFGLPTAAQPARRVQVGMSFRF